MRLAPQSYQPQRDLYDPNLPVGVVGLILAFFLPPIGLPVSIVQWATYGIYIGCAVLLMMLVVPVAIAFGA
ncbi:hypothetical protein [Arthrobacter monumenti]